MPGSPPAPAGAPPPAAPAEGSRRGGLCPDVFRLEITGSVWVASLMGYLQTSKGGGAGTTSDERPKLSEIGLDGLNLLPMVDARLTFFRSHEIHVNYVGIDIEGSDTLGKDLTSQDVTFPAGSKVQSHLELDLLFFGYRPGWLALDFSGWSLTPEVGLSIDPFRYRLKSGSVAGEVDRAYTVAFPYLGLLLEGPVIGPLRAELNVAGSYGIGGATYVDADTRLVWRLVETEGFEASLVVGLRGTWFRRRDHQTPEFNDINLLMGAFSTEPWGGLTAGIRIAF